MKSRIYRWNTGKIFDLIGKDVVSWLQGQVTQDVSNISLRNPIFFCFCNISGFIEGIGILLKIPAGIRVIVDHKSAQVLQERLDNIFLEEICVEKVNSSIILGFGDQPDKEVFLLYQPCWGEWISFGNLSDIELLSELEWRRLCLINRMPFMEIDIKKNVFPIELGEKFDQFYVHYQKGCYVGQEVLMRLHTKGRPRWQWMVFKTIFPLEGVLDHPLQKEGLEVTSCIDNKDGTYLCGIYVHRNIYNNNNNNISIISESKRIIGVIL